MQNESRCDKAKKIKAAFFCILVEFSKYTSAIQFFLSNTLVITEITEISR